jgi:AcrR family transcriptional regulator
VHRLRDRLRKATAAEILDAAEDVFGREGLHAARMEDVASRAGVSVGTLYNYFSDRNALIGALLASRRAVLLAEVDAALAQNAEAPFVMQLERMLETFFAHFEAHRRLATILFQSETGFGAREAMRVLYQRFEKLIARGVASGALHPDLASLYPALLFGMVRGVLMRRLHADTRDTRQLGNDVPALVGFFMRGAVP